jgi:hypothetical protein
MSFADFAKDDPTQIVLGLFNGELQAVYLFRQISPTEFEAHFTSNRRALRSNVLAGAAQMVRWFSEQGLEIIGHIHMDNGPLRRFLEEAGLSDTESSCQGVSNSATVSATVDTFAEYRSQVNPNRAERIKAEDQQHVGNDG